MEQKQIVLLTANRSPVAVDLFNRPPQGNVWENDINSYTSVFSDQEYNFRLENIDTDSIVSLSVFINDDEQEGYLDNNVFYFTKNSSKKSFPFRNMFGFAELSLTVSFEDGKTESYYTDYLSILVHRGQELKTINTMIDYVYHRQDQLLITDDVGTKRPGDVKKSPYINLETKISLAREILRLYKDSYGYFSANSRFKTDILYAVDDANKLQTITPKTLQYIATNPGYLMEGTFNNGIQIGNKHYIPRKTLVQKYVYSFDTYENQIIVGFLGKMLDDINLMARDVNELLRSRNVALDTPDDYIHSSYFIFQRTNAALTNNLTQLSSLKKEFEIVRGRYRKALKIEGTPIKKMPLPSATFMMVAQYNRVYRHIQRWFDYGIYNLEQERFMMSFINGSTLYEVYALAKLLEAVSRLGFEPVSQYRYFYKTSRDSFYKNTMCNNTFVFSRARNRLTVYYQPIIFNSDYKPANGINLYRNNTLSMEGYGSYYYTPDYVIKYEKNGEEKYLIIDAKFGNRDFVRTHQVAKLAFKYLFSISPRENQNLLGLYILYGYSHGFEGYESVYDKQINGTQIYPKFDLVPIAAGISNERHMQYLTAIIGDAID